MPQNSEQIESKLCAYIEGELDERGRVEIERHLQANPHHRKLLSELAATRKFVQDLPRDSAPTELYEMFQSQLERSVLLDYNDGRDEPAVYGRINRFPQVFAAAAIVMLAIGLGLIVYFALPITGTRTNQAVAINEAPLPATAPLVLETPDSEGTERLPRDADVVRKFAAAPSTSSSPTTLPAAGTTPPDVPSLPAIAEKVRSAASGDAAAGMFADVAKPSERLADVAKRNERLAEPLVMVVSAKDPSAAEGTLRRALQSLPGVLWADATTSLTDALDTTSLAANDEEKLQLHKKVGEFSLGTPGAAPEPAAQTRMLKQATEVVRRSEARRSELESERVDQLNETLAKREAGATGPQPAAPITLPAEQENFAAAAPAPAPAPSGPAPSTRAGGYSPVAPAAPAVAAGAKPRQPQAPSQVALRSANDQVGQRALDEGANDADQAPSFARSNRARYAAPLARTGAPASSQPVSQSPAAEEVELARAYRVIVAQNVPRAQVESLRQQLGAAFSKQQQQEEAQQQVTLYYGNGPARVTETAKTDASVSRPAEALTPNVTVPATQEGLTARADAAPRPDAFGGAGREDMPVRAKSAVAASAATSPTAVVGQRSASPAVQPPIRLNTAKDRTVRSGDTLRLSIAEAGKPPLEQDVRVANDGTLVLPRSGESVYADRLTVKELEKHLEATIARQKASAGAVGSGGGASGFGGPDRAGGAGGGGTAAKPEVRRAAAPDGARPAGTATARVTIATVVPAAPATQPALSAAPAKPAAQPDSRANLATTAPARPIAPSAPVDTPVAAAADKNSASLELSPASAAAAPGVGRGGIAGNRDDNTPVEVVFILRQAQASPPPAIPAQTSSGLPPTAQPIRDSEFLTVTVQDPANPSTTNLQVGEDGTIEIPQVGKVKALGRAPSEVEYEIESRWRQANVNAKSVAKAKVVRLGDSSPAEPPPAAATPAPGH